MFLGIGNTDVLLISIEQSRRFSPNKSSLNFPSIGTISLITRPEAIIKFQHYLFLLDKVCKAWVRFIVTGCNNRRSFWKITKNLFVFLFSFTLAQAYVNALSRCLYAHSRGSLIILGEKSLQRGKKLNAIAEVNPGLWVYTIQVLKPIWLGILAVKGKSIVSCTSIRKKRSVNTVILP